MERIEELEILMNKLIQDIHKLSKDFNNPNNGKILSISNEIIDKNNQLLKYREELQKELNQ